MRKIDIEPLKHKENVNTLFLEYDSCKCNLKFGRNYDITKLVNQVEFPLKSGLESYEVANFREWIRAVEQNIKDKTCRKTIHYPVEILLEICSADYMKNIMVEPIESARTIYVTIPEEFVKNVPKDWLASTIAREFHLNFGELKGRNIEEERRRLEFSNFFRDVIYLALRANAAPGGLSRTKHVQQALKQELQDYSSMMRHEYEQAYAAGKASRIHGLLPMFQNKHIKLNLDGLDLMKEIEAFKRIPKVSNFGSVEESSILQSYGLPPYFLHVHDPNSTSPVKKMNLPLAAEEWYADFNNALNGRKGNVVKFNSKLKIKTGLMPKAKSVKL